MNRIMMRHRRGMSLIEVIIFIALFSFVITILFPILFISTQNRYLQQTVAVVEQNGTQIANTAVFQLRHAESILDPPPGQTGAVLALQTGSGATNPTIIGVESGTL
ncbi:MAG: prepilin-type N-terminal cleavage/methylation domain-containing protein, partial [Patescibacteria group bacterium]